MLTRPFGKTGLHITPLGLGTWAMGGDRGGFSWGPQDDQASIDAIKRGLDLGINWVDTAAVYGFGHAEEIVGEAIKGREHLPLIFTKCSILRDDQGQIHHSMKASSIQREVEASLRRLAIEAIDLYQIHWPIPEAEIEEGWSKLAELKKQGKVRHIGVSNFSLEQMQRIERIAPIETHQLPYSLIRQDAEREILPYCQEHQIGVLAYSPMESGLLTGLMTKEQVNRLSADDWRRESPEFREPRLSRNLELANQLEEIGYLHNVPAGVVAIAWTLRNPAITATIVGSRSPAQIEEMIVAAEFRLSKSELEQIEKFLAEHP